MPLYPTELKQSLDKNKPTCRQTSISPEVRNNLLADRGYDAHWIRALAAKKCAWANIPPRSNRHHRLALQVPSGSSRARVAAEKPSQAYFHPSNHLDTQGPFIPNVEICCVCQSTSVIARSIACVAWEYSLAIRAGVTGVKRDSAIFFRRRHQPTRPPPAKIRPGRPAPAMGAGTARNASGPVQNSNLTELIIGLSAPERLEAENAQLRDSVWNSCSRFKHCGPKFRACTHKSRLFGQSLAAAKRVRIATNVQVLFFRRRHQPRRPPLAKIRPGSPAPAMGPGTTAMELTSSVPHGEPGQGPL
jgi:hypothetical protein